MIREDSKRIEATVEVPLRSSQRGHQPGHRQRPSTAINGNQKQSAAVSAVRGDRVPNPRTLIVWAFIV